MGQAIYRICSEKNSPYNLAAGLSRSLGPDIRGVIISKNARDVFWASDVVVDFSHPSLTEDHLGVAKEAGKPFLLGASGFDRIKLTPLMEDTSKTIPFMDAPNTSLGIALIQKMLGACIKALGSDTDVEILERHHRNKADAPSGTALALAEGIQKAQTAFLGQGGDIVWDRTQGVRHKGDIGIGVLRGGERTSEHQVMFLGAGEELTLCHKVASQDLLARGALRLSQWLKNQMPGYYTPQGFLA
jgi:4-hydroxy-tetrahydrodipicolinate reductase